LNWSGWRDVIFPGRWSSWQFQLSSADAYAANRIENAKDVE
jgi:hypothetical protein